MTDNNFKKNVIYTAIFSNSKPIDNLENFKKMKNWDYILFTNLDPNIFSNTPWTVIQTRKFYTCNVMCARYIKWIGGGIFLNSYENLIWTDAYIILNNEKEEELYNIVLKNNISFKEHPYTNCIYDECKQVIIQNKDSKYKVMINMNIFLRDNMPKKYGLIETNIIIYKNNKENKQFFKKVFEFMINKSYRDQLSLTYNIWKYNFENFTKLPYNFIQEFIRIDTYYSNSFHNMISYKQ
jgi:hypothetical protein